MNEDYTPVLLLRIYTPVFNIKFQNVPRIYLFLSIFVKKRKYIGATQVGCDPGKSIRLGVLYFYFQ